MRIALRATLRLHLDGDTRRRIGRERFREHGVHPRQIGDVGEIDRAPGRRRCQPKPAVLQQRCRSLPERLPGLRVDVLARRPPRRRRTDRSHRRRPGADVVRPAVPKFGGRRRLGRDERQLGADRAGQPRHHHQARAATVDRARPASPCERGRLVEPRGIAPAPTRRRTAPEPGGLQRRRDVGDGLRDLRLDRSPTALVAGSWPPMPETYSVSPAQTAGEYGPSGAGSEPAADARPRCRRDPRSRCTRSRCRRSPAAPRPAPSSAPARGR